MKEPSEIRHSTAELNDVLNEYSLRLNDLPDEEYEDINGQAYRLLTEYSRKYGYLPFFSDCIIIYASRRKVDIARVLRNLHENEHAIGITPHPHHVYSNVPDYTEERINIAKQIAEKIMANAAGDNRKPKAFPLMCGTGKSSSLSYIIRDTIQKNDGSGLIIVTDSVERMHNYVEKQPGGDDELKQFLDENRDKITILESGPSYETAWHNKEKTPVLILSTQRYFNELDSEKLHNLFEWNGGHRNLVIFDEMPYMQHIADVTNENINSALSDLQNGISDYVEAVDRDWCIAQWKTFSSALESRLDLYYNVYREEQKSYFVYKHPFGHITEDDDRFFSILQRSRFALESKRFRLLQFMNTIRKLVSSPTLVYSGKRNNMRFQKFIVKIDNLDRIADIPAQAIILDGTADISPEYDRNAIDLVPCEGFERDLNRLEIRLVNTKATKDALTRHNWLAPAIERYVKNEMRFVLKPIVFTYQDVEETFRNNFITAHFGDIKGRNIYRDSTMIAQVGINRFDETYYIALGLYNGVPSLYDEIAEMKDPVQQAKAIDSILNDNHRFRDVMIRKMVADMEQNLFRGCIRDPFNDFAYTYLVLYEFSADDVSGLREAIHSRYEALQAHVFDVPEPEEIKELRKTPWASEQISQKKLVLDWINKQKTECPERVFRIKEMLSEIQLPCEDGDANQKTMIQRQFNKIKERYPEVKDMFNRMRIGKTRQYSISTPW